jgi:ATP-binding cassette subfamily F protein uup
VRLERQIERLRSEEERLHADLAAHASDFERLADLDRDLRDVVARRESLEEEWLEVAEAAE